MVNCSAAGQKGRSNDGCGEKGIIGPSCSKDDWGVEVSYTFTAFYAGQENPPGRMGLVIIICWKYATRPQRSY